MGPNGSMNTRGGPSSRNADWPNQRTLTTRRPPTRTIRTGQGACCTRWLVTLPSTVRRAAPWWMPATTRSGRACSQPRVDLDGRRALQEHPLGARPLRGPPGEPPPRGLAHRPEVGLCTSRRRSAGRGGRGSRSAGRRRRPAGAGPRRPRPPRPPSRRSSRRCASTERPWRAFGPGMPAPIVRCKHSPSARPARPAGCPPLRQEVVRVRELEGAVGEPALQVAELVAEVGDDVVAERLDVRAGRRLVVDRRARAVAGRRRRPPSGSPGSPRRPAW